MREQVGKLHCRRGPCRLDAHALGRGDLQGHLAGHDVEGFADLTRKYVVGNPLDASTTLGPMARGSFADTVRSQIEEARRKGATALINMKAGRPPGLTLSRA